MDESNETEFPLASFSLTLDDELQYRCAGFIQAEIERYAEFIDESGEWEGSRSQHSEGSEEDNDVGEGDNATTPTKARRPKKVHKTGTYELHAANKEEFLISIQPNWIHATYWKESIFLSMLYPRFYGPSVLAQSGFNMGRSCWHTMVDLKLPLIHVRRSSLMPFAKRA